jgi:hypothetical protein
MSSVNPGFTFTSSTPVNATNLNLIAQPSVTPGVNEITLAMMAQLATNKVLGRSTAGTGNVEATTVSLAMMDQRATNTLLGRSTAGTGDVEAIDLTTSGLGYRTGAGGVVTQLTNKQTPVTLSKVCGQITTATAGLSPEATIAFTLTNTLIGATDNLILNHVSGGTIGMYTLDAACGAGSATITLRNNSTATTEYAALVIRFILIKGATS